MNLYDQLGVPPAANDDEIKAAYRDRVRQVHPDKGGTNEACAAVNQAYAILADPASRSAYDRGEIDEDGSVNAASALINTIWGEILGNRHGYKHAYTDLVAVARQMIAAVRNQIALDRNKLTVERDRLQDIAARLTDADILLAATKSRAAALNNQLSDLDQQDAIAIAAAAMLKAAKYRIETEAAVRARSGALFDDMLKRRLYSNSTITTTAP